MYLKLHGQYVRHDGGAYKYYGRCTREIPYRWEVHVWRQADQPVDVHLGYRCELSGDLVNVPMSEDLLQKLAVSEVERRLEEMPLI